MINSLISSSLISIYLDCLMLSSRSMSSTYSSTTRM